MRLAFSLPILLLLPQFAAADKVDDAVLAYMKAANVPGMSVAVIRNGKPVKVKGYGFANLEHGVKVKPETIFQSGSVGKQFTAALVMKLVEDGKIGLDDSIRKYFPTTPETWEKITIRHLLTHTSGLPDPYDKIDFRKDYTEQELLALDTTLPLIFQPGENWSYSNTGYHVLGFLCSKVGGKFYGDQLVERVLRPAGMKTARIIDEESLIMHRSAGYEVRNGKIFNQSWVAPQLNTTADGSLYVSLLDMIAWDSALNDSKVLSENIKKQMWTPVKLNNGKENSYGFGWDLKPLNGRKLISHNGSWQGFKTSIMRFVDDKLTVIVLANSASTNPSKISQEIAGHYVPALAPIKLKPIADKSPEVTDLLAKFLDGTGEEAHKMLASEMKNRLTPEILSSRLVSLKVTGKRKTPILLSAEMDGAFRVFQYTVTYGTQNYLVRLRLNANNEIEGISLSDE